MNYLFGKVSLQRGRPALRDDLFYLYERLPYAMGVQREALFVFPMKPIPKPWRNRRRGQSREEEFWRTASFSFHHFFWTSKRNGGYALTKSDARGAALLSMNRSDYFFFAGTSHWQGQASLAFFNSIKLITSATIESDPVDVPNVNPLERTCAL